MNGKCFGDGNADDPQLSVEGKMPSGTGWEPTRKQPGIRWDPAGDPVEIQLNICTGAGTCRNESRKTIKTMRVQRTNCKPDPNRL